MSKYTKGPWEPRRHLVNKYDRKFDAWIPVARTWGETQEEANANANLIAAAPDMLEALKSFRDYLKSKAVITPTGYHKERQKILDKIEESIAKAEVES
jgi:hypothetical protein